MTHKGLFFLLFFQFAAVSAHAQNNVDTILHMLEGHPKEDTTRLLIWATLAKEYMKVDLDKGLSALDTVIRLAQKLNLPGWEANSYNGKGAAYFGRGEYSQALKSFQKALVIAELINNKRRISQSISNIASVYITMGNYVTALEYLNKAVDISKSINQKDGVAEGYSAIGEVYVEMTNFSKALEYTQKAIRIRKEIDDEEGMRIDFNVMASIYSALNDHDKAIDYCKKSLLIDEEEGDNQSKVSDLSNLAANFESSGAYSLAIGSRLQALKIAEDMGLEGEIMNIFIALEFDYAKIADYKNSVQYSLKTEKLSEKISDTITKALQLINLGYLYANAPPYLLHANGIDSSACYLQALDYLYRGLTIATNIKKLDFQRNAWEYISDVYTKQKNYIKALDAYQNFISIRDSILNDEKRKEITRREIGFEYEKKEDSLKLQEQITNGKLEQQLLFGKQQKQQLEIDKKELDITYKEKDLQKLAYLKTQADLQNEQLEKRGKEEQLTISEKEKQLQLAKVKSLEQEKKLNAFKQQQQWIYLIVGLILIGFVGIYFFYRARLQQISLKTQMATERVEQQQKEAEFQRQLGDISLSALRSQMNPHFIFNCLNSIKLYTTQNDTVAASEYLTKFSRLIRLVLENSRNERITLASEFDALRLYLEMEVMRFKEKLKYDITVEKEVDMDYIEIPPLLLQPYVENAIWHGLMQKEEGGRIDITVGLQPVESILIINITDNGIGRVKSAALMSKTATKHKSYGMKVTSERLALINQVYKTGANVTIHDLSDDEGKTCGTRVTIKIPLE